MKLSKFQILVGSMLAVGGDVGSGLMIGTIFGFIYSNYFLHHWLLVYVISIISAFSPDLDVILKIIGVKTRRFDGHHRVILHKPICFVLIFCGWSVVAVTLHWALIWPQIFLFGAMMHFVHDTLWDHNFPGIQWGWPFWTAKIALYCRKAWQGEYQKIVISAADARCLGYSQWIHDYYYPRISIEALREVAWLLFWLLIAAVRVGISINIFRHLGL